MNTVLITGIGGYVGSAVLSVIPVRYRVVGFGRGRNFDVARRIAKERGLTLALIRGDIADPWTVRHAAGAVNAVVHTAGIVGNNACLKDPWEAMRVNIRGARSLVEAIGSRTRLIHISTQSVYGTFAERPMPLRETMRMQPDDLYGATKAEAEWEIGRARGIILRATSLYGIGSGAGHKKNVISKFVAMASEGKPITPFGDGSQGVDFVHVRDLAAAVVAALAAPRSASGTYNVGTGRATPMREVAALVQAQIPGARIAYEPAPPGKLWPSRWVSVSKARRVLGWKPAIALADGIADVVAYHHENN